MSTNNILLTIGAFIILTTILQNIYGLVGTTGDDVANAQDMILATSIATSYLELAQGLAFDEFTDTTEAAIGNPSLLTPPGSLGPETSAEKTVGNFSDFDDFSGLQFESQPTGTNKRFAAAFSVFYVNPANVDVISNTPTFVKRMDIRVWRTYPPPEGVASDTLRMSYVMGYFHFD